MCCAAGDAEADLALEVAGPAWSGPTPVRPSAPLGVDVVIAGASVGGPSRDRVGGLLVAAVLGIVVVVGFEGGRGAVSGEGEALRVATLLPLFAGLCDAVVVVDAGFESGSRPRRDLVDDAGREDDGDGDDDDDDEEAAGAVIAIGLAIAR